MASRHPHCQLSSGSNHTLSLGSWAPFHGDSAAPCWARSCNKQKQLPYSAHSAGTRDAIQCLVTQLRLTLCDPVDCSPPASSVHGILQARILEWVAMPSSRGSSQPRVEPRSLAVQEDSLPSEPPGNPKNTRVGSYPFSRGTYQAKNQTRVSCIAGRLFTSSATREAQ